MSGLKQARTVVAEARRTEIATPLEVRSGRAALSVACGELVQGTLDGVRCLVSCPIDRYVTAKVDLRSVPGRANGSPVWDVPGDRPKAVAALQTGLMKAPGESRESVELVRLRLASTLPRGRGYASSTADVGATLYALGQALGQSMAPEDVARLAVSIEPSDSTIFPGLALFDHRAGRFHKHLGAVPPLDILLIDPGGKVDTLAFNRLDHRAILKRLASRHREAFHLLFEGLQAGNWSAVGEAATLSARAHQVILPNPLLDPVLRLAGDVNALGVCRAHSGTLLGLLLDPANVDVEAALNHVTRALPPEVTIQRDALRGGGPSFEPSERSSTT